MALDQTTLQSAILAAFKKAKNTPPPPDPSQASAVQEQILTQLAQDLADAMSQFVKGGDVIGVTVDVSNTGGTKIGTGTQTGTGKIE
ncbi:hypothetical protein [Sorangium sp. So ce1000]|uniref:hypothetical protein n=1 Tax=Sorangium sp. So ce1000 TaxID=3133325 RepID=UPI003F613425